MQNDSRKKRPKVIAFYLPQFHRILENDLWWGEGFTDWDSARTAKPLFRNHYQPRLPRHGYFYNLLDKNVMQWQAELAKKAGIYGFCIYHYWFGDKQLLEKPAENLLKWKDIKIHYCFSWANESWIASWSRLKGNRWKQDGDCNREKSFNGYLAYQKYGSKEEWKTHFEYLLPFFKDARYIKKDGKPVFVIYKPQDLKCSGRMIPYWNELAVENGLKGIYFIATNSSRIQRGKMDAALLYEPVYSIFNGCKVEGLIQDCMLVIKNIAEKTGHVHPTIVSYKMVWRMILHRKTDGNTYYGGFVDFDTSPRKGGNAYVFEKATPKKFGKYFSSLYKKSAKEGKDFVFLTAWNEWGEGAYLEPDCRYGFQYLKAVRDAVKIQQLRNCKDSSGRRQLQRRK